MATTGNPLPVAGPHSLFAKLLTAASFGLAIHYIEIQKSWSSCGEDSFCKAEKLVLYMTAIFGVSSPSVLLSGLIKKYANKASVSQTGSPIFAPGAYWGPTMISVGIYTWIEYQLSFWWNWVNYSTQCLKQGVCTTDDIMVWITNMKIKHCNKTYVNVDVELDCVDGDCIEGKAEDVMKRIKDPSDWCVVIFNEMPLLMSAFAIWAFYVVSYNWQLDDLDDGTGAGNANANGNGTANGNGGTSGQGQGDGGSSGQRDGGSSGQGDGRSSGQGDGRSSGQRDGGSSGQGDGGSSGQGGGGSSGQGDGSSTSTGTGKGGTKGPNGKTPVSKPTPIGEGDGDKQDPPPKTQTVQVTCPICNLSRCACIPNPLSIYCHVCSPTLTSTPSTATESTGTTNSHPLSLFPSSSSPTTPTSFTLPSTFKMNASTFNGNGDTAQVICFGPQNGNLCANNAQTDDDDEEEEDIDLEDLTDSELAYLAQYHYADIQAIIEECDCNNDNGEYKVLI